MMRHWWLGGVLVCLLSSVLMARQGLVRTLDGHQYEGDIKEAADGSVDISSHGGVLTIPKSQILSIDYEESLQISQFQDRLSKLGPNDVKGRMDLARWALEHNEFDLAMQAAQAAQRIQPGNDEIATLLNTIESQRTLMSHPSTAPAQTTVPAPTAPRPVSKFLPADDINAIRLNELQPDDTVRIQFLENVKSRFLALLGSGAADLKSAEPVDLALAIAAKRDANLNKDVRVYGDPKSLMDYRRRIQPRVLAGCAASGCHGGTGSGGFFLYPDADQQPVWYTNFYILQTYRKNVEVADAFGHGMAQRPMIDRVHPEASLLVQYSLPRNLASTPHPKVNNFKGIFRTTQDPDYTSLVTWIGSTLRAVEPDYGITFDIPKGKAPAAEQKGGAPATPTDTDARTSPPAPPAATTDGALKPRPDK